jgi:hypothetical protein
MMACCGCCLHKQASARQAMAPVEFKQGKIDFDKKIIWVYPPPNVDVTYIVINARPLIEKIPGKVTCLFTAPMRTGVGWYRNEQGEVIETDSRLTPEGKQYLLQMQDPANQHFSVRLCSQD